MKSILVYGDSITWGFLPTLPIVEANRYPAGERWPDIMASVLGDGYSVVSEGLCGRTTNIDDPLSPGLLNGISDLGNVMTRQEALDLVILFLGTNDAKSHLNRTPREIGHGMNELVSVIRKDPGPDRHTCNHPDILIVSPPPLGPVVASEFAEEFRNGHEKIAALPRIYADIAEVAGVHFFDAGTVVDVSMIGPDGIHMSPEANQVLGCGIAKAVKQAFCGEDTRPWGR